MKLHMLGALALLPLAAHATTWTVGSGKNFATPETIDWTKVKPGDTVLIYPGTYGSTKGTGNSMTLNGVVGSASLPITVKAYSTAPVLSSGINITGSTQYVTIAGLDVTRNALLYKYAAIVVQGNAHDVTLSQLKVHNAYVGIGFSGAGLRNRIEASEVYSSSTNGIGLDAYASTAIPDDANRSVLSGNNIHDNGGHGVEILSSYWRVEKNVVTNNGKRYGGTSGIHLFSRADVPGAVDCDRNVIVYNYVSLQHDTQAADGNGIQIDNFCDYNTVAWNVLWNSDGAGFSLLDGAYNQIYANTSYRNARASKSSGVVRGELIFTAYANLCSNPNVDSKYCNVPAGRSSNNVIYDNLTYSDQAAVPAIITNTEFTDPSRNSNAFYPNLYWNSASGGTMLSWQGKACNTAASIDSVTGLSAQGGGNLVELPKFVNTAAPGKGSDGLRLSAQPSNQGWVINPPQPDMLGTMPSSGIAWYGAYYTR